MGFEMVCAADAGAERNPAALPQNFCGYVLHGEKIDWGRYDGILFTNCCSGIQRLYDRVRRQAPALYLFMLEVSRYDGTIVNFPELISSLSERFGSVKMHDPDTEHRWTDAHGGPLISLTAAARRKKKARQKYRAGRGPLGSFIRKEGQAGVRAVLPADVRIRPGMQRIGISDEWLKDIEPREPDSAENKILVLASALPQTYAEEMKKIFGCDTLAFDTCFHTDRGDLVQIGRDCPACPRMLFYGRWCRERIRTARAVVYIVSKQCDFSMFSAPEVSRLCESAGKRLLILEEAFPHRLSAHSRLRFEAFAECLYSDRHAAFAREKL